LLKGAGVTWFFLGVLSTATLVSLAFTWIVRHFARLNGWAQGPISSRHVHTLPVPRIGGIAIFFSLASTTAIFAFAKTNTSLFAAALIGAGWMFVIGLTDDLVGVSASRKLLAQLIGGLVIFALGIRIPVPGALGICGSAISLALTLIWSVVVMNSVNLIDGLDGLASGSVSFATLAIVLAALRFGSTEIIVLGLVLLGTLLGFLRFNLHPATIFLGDSGSLVIGAIVSVLTIRLIQVTRLGAIIGILVLLHPFAELCLSTIRRAITAHPIFRPDRRHLHHRLLDREISHEHSARGLVFGSAVFSTIGVLAAMGGLRTALALVLAAIVARYMFAAFRYHEFEYLKLLPARIRNSRYVIDAHVKLRELQAAMEQAQTFDELKVLVGRELRSIGFAGVIFEVPELNRGSRGSRPARGVEIVFPIMGRVEHLGSLHLRWDLNAPPPLDINVFREEFVPVLEHAVAAHVYRSREVELPMVKYKTRKPMLVPKIAVPDRAVSELKPLHN
jgi:UDP-GlcNAc:undecaprenyl-phosphate/decaprenyl-phosphate GlcNAc-1-phosphate transferase